MQDHVADFFFLAFGSTIEKYPEQCHLVYFVV